MNDFTPEQRAAIETLDRNLLVKAGAGAGKTRVLVERYVHVLATGAADTDGIVAITFTRKAAREMKERIREKVNELVSGAAETEERNRWRDVSQRLDAVNISTIHSLCSRILREHPAEAGVDPDFGLLEDIDETALLDEVWQQTLEQAVRSESGWLKRLLEVYSPAQIRQEFRPLFDAVLKEGLIGPELERELWPPSAGAGIDCRMHAERLKQAYQELFALAAVNGKKKTKAQDRILVLQGEWGCIEQKIDNVVQDLSLLDELDAAFKGMHGGANLGEVLQERKKASEGLRGGVLDQVVHRLTPDLCEWFQLVGASWTRIKQDCRMLTYDDLEKNTERLLLDHPEICGRYNRRIRFLMVDECQDINERQRRIIYLLAGGDAEILHRLILFAVGDGKQSIYRFRGADTRVFVRVQEDVCRSGGRVIELLDNFRSHHQLVVAFNDFFAELMPSPVCEEDTDGADAVEYRNLQGNRGGDEPAGVDLWVLDAETLSGDAREQEAMMIARRIRMLVEEQSLQYKDIAVLLRAFTHVASYEAAFAQAGIPYYVAGSRGFADKQEIMDVLELLRFFCNPLNEQALFATLRAPFFQLSDDALLRLRRTGGSGGLWAGLMGAAETGGLTEAEVTAALRAGALLERWLARSGFLTPERLIREVFDATGFDAFQLTQFMGVRRYANLMKLLDLANAFMSVENGGIAEFLAYVELRASQEGEAEIDSEAGNTVRIMTIHKSKGLEFPVVIVPDLQRKFNSRVRMTVFVRGLGMGLKVPDSRGKLMESGRFRRIARQDNAMERAELKRILYVAMTRAERNIILSAVARQPKTEKNLRNAAGWLDWARKLFGLEGSPKEWPVEKCFGETCLRICVGEGEGAPEFVQQLLKEAPPVLADAVLPPEIRRNLEPISVQTVRPIVMSPSYLSEYTACPRRYFYAHICRLPQIMGYGPILPDRRDVMEAELPMEITPLKLGIAFHKFLELLPTRDVWQEAMDQALRETLPTLMQEQAAELLREWAVRYAESALYEELRSVPEERREWPFQHRLLPQQGKLGAVWLSGQVDRILFYPDGTLGIVDYKTDHLEPDLAQKKTARYRLQLASYALAARTVFGREIRDTRLYFARTGETALIDTGDDALASAMRDLQNIAEYIRSHGNEVDYACMTDHCSYCAFQAVCARK